jgi:pimeloyl-ACP methyl ester carboxylesterase
MRRMPGSGRTAYSPAHGARLGLRVMPSPRMLLVLAALGAACAAPAAASAKVPTGPSGVKFYTPPKKLPGKAHGDLIRARKLKGAAALSAAGSNRLVLYRSTSAEGKAVAVSGTVAVPKGKAPKGGWPVISWGHGTTGIADQCAPSRDSKGNPAHGYIDYAYPTLNGYLKAGYAVVQTDYQGLGTPGTHEFLAGVPEGRSVLDMVRAARKLDPRLSKRVALVGHSQGGQAVLYAASLAPKWTPELKIRGTVAFAPVSHLSGQAAAIPLLTQPSSLSAYAGIILRGIDTAVPKGHFSGLLSPKGKALFPQTLTKCQADLVKPSSFGGVAPADLIRSDADLKPLEAALAAKDDTESVRIKTPVQVDQGTADTTVFPNFTDDLVSQFQARKNPVTYLKYDGVSHGGVVTAAGKNALTFLKGRF